MHTLLLAAKAPDPDALVDIVLAPISPDVYSHQRHRLGLASERIVATLDRLAHRLLDPAP